MQWASLAEFLSMGGRGLYVWGSYGVTALLIVAELVILARRGRTPDAGFGRSAGPDDAK
jgi:heme exporter protein D